MPGNPLTLTISGIATDNKNLTLKQHPELLQSLWGANRPKKDGEKKRTAVLSPGLLTYGGRWHIKRNKSYHSRCWKNPKEDHALCKLCVNVQTRADWDAVRDLHRGALDISWPLAPALTPANSEEPGWEPGRPSPWLSSCKNETRTGSG